MATLLPWNFFITPFAYWMTKLQRSDWQNHTTTVPELTTMTTALTNVSVQVNASRDGKGMFPNNTSWNISEKLRLVCGKITCLAE